MEDLNLEKLLNEAIKELEMNNDPNGNKVINENCINNKEYKTVNNMEDSISKYKNINDLRPSIYPKMQELANLLKIYKPVVIDKVKGNNDTPQTISDIARHTLGIFLDKMVDMLNEQEN